MHDMNNLRRMSPVKSRPKMALLCILSMSTIFYVLYALSQRKPSPMKEYYDTNIRKSPPVLVRILGGIGNQLFQYAAAFSIAKKRNSDIHICVFNYENDSKTVDPSHYSSTPTKRNYALDQFNVPQGEVLYVSENVKCSINYYSNFRKADTFIVNEENALAGDLPDDKILYAADNFESDVFFASDKPDILHIYKPIFDTHPIQHLIELVLAAENSVSVHIRRDDFGSQADFRLISISYQIEAMQLIKQKLKASNVTFFVFTDDLDYVKNHLEEGNFEPSNIVYMSEFTNGNTLYDFLLMSICLHNIISNSTFSWWAAYLNRNPIKIVVAPMPKFTSALIDKLFNSAHKRQIVGELAYPKDWITLKPTFLNCTED